MDSVSKKLMRVGSLDEVVIIVGLPGFGKSCQLTRMVNERAKEISAYRIAVDVGMRIPRVLPDGTPTGLVYYSTPGEPARPMASQLSDLHRQFRDGRTAGLHTLCSASATDALTFSIALARATMTKPDENGDRWGHPVVLEIDEAMMWRTEDGGVAGGGRLGDLMENFLVSRRHTNVALYLGTQAPHRVHYLTFEMATVLYSFRLDSNRGLSRLREGGVPESVLARLATLRGPNEDGSGPRECLRWVRGRPDFTVTDLATGKSVTPEMPGEQMALKP